jgi:hypothetical protein
MFNQANDVLNQATARIIRSVANFLPGLLALAIAILLAFLIAWVVRAMIRRSLRGIAFDKRVEQWGFPGMSEWSPGGSPSLLIAQLAYWSILFMGVLIGLSALDANLISLMVMRMFGYLPNVIAAFIIVFLGVFIARFVARGVLISAVNMQIHSARLLSLGVKWLVMVMAGAMALDHLGIGGPIVRLAFGILFGGIVLALALAVGLGSKELVSRSLERQASRTEEDELRELHHL